MPRRVWPLGSDGNGRSDIAAPGGFRRIVGVESLIDCDWDVYDVLLAVLLTEPEKSLFLAEGESHDESEASNDLTGRMVDGILATPAALLDTGEPFTEGLRDGVGVLVLTSETLFDGVCRLAGLDLKRLFFWPFMRPVATEWPR